MLLKIFFRNKQSKYFIFLFSLIFLLFLEILNLNYESKLQLEKEKEYYSNREIKVISVQNDNEFLDIDHIVAIYKDFYVVGIFQNKNLYLQTFISQKNIPILKGRKIQNENEILLPQEYEEYLNQTIWCTVDNKEYSFVVVGIVENDTFVYDNSIFSNEDTGYLLLVDQTKHVDEVLKKLKEKNINGNIADTSHYPYQQETLNSFYRMICKIFIGFIIVTFYEMIKLFFMENQKNMAVLKSLGYPCNTIFLLLLLNFSFIFLISFMNSFIPSILLSNLIPFHMQSIYDLFLILFILLIIGFLSFYFMIHKTSEIMLYKNNHS